MANKTEPRVDTDSKAHLEALVDECVKAGSLASNEANRARFDRAAWKLFEFVHGNIERITLFDK